MSLLPAPLKQSQRPFRDLGLTFQWQPKRLKFFREWLVLHASGKDAHCRTCKRKRHDSHEWWKREPERDRDNKLLRRYFPVV